MYKKGSGSKSNDFLEVANSKKESGQWVDRAVDELKNTELPHRRMSLDFENLKTSDENKKEQDHLDCKGKLQNVFNYYDEEKNAIMDPGCMRMHHLSLFRKFWDGVTCILLIYLAVTLPLIVGIGGETEGMVNIMNIIDWWFIVDVFLNFFTTYDDASLNVVCDLRKIGANYLRSWFLIDFISSIPLEQLGFADSGDVGFLKAAKLLKLLKLMRVFRFGRLIQRMQQRFQVKHGSIMILKFCLAIMILAHWLGCIFYLFTSLFETEESWNHVYLAEQEGGALYLRSSTSKYIAVLYWAITTMSTIGYGDISPRTDTERVFVTLAMMVGAGTFAYGLTNVCSAVFNYNQFQVKFEGCQDELADFLKAHRIPMATRQRIQQYLWYKYNSSTVEVFPESRDQLLSLLSRPLRDETLFHICDRIFPRGTAYESTLLNVHGSAFKLDFAREIGAELFSPQDFIVTGEDANEMSAADQAIMFLLKGEALVSKGYSSQMTSQNESTYTITDGCTWGERTMMAQTKFNWTVRATTFCDIYSISFLKVHKILDKHWPIEKKGLQQSWRAFEKSNVSEFKKEFLFGETGEQFRQTVIKNTDALRARLVAMKDERDEDEVDLDDAGVEKDHQSQGLLGGGSRVPPSKTAKTTVKPARKFDDPRIKKDKTSSTEGIQMEILADRSAGKSVVAPLSDIPLAGKDKTAHTTPLHSGLSRGSKREESRASTKGLADVLADNKDALSRSREPMTVDQDTPGAVLRDILNAAHASLLDELMSCIPQGWSDTDDFNATEHLAKLMTIQRKYYTEIKDQIKDLILNADQPTISTLSVPNVSTL